MGKFWMLPEDVERPADHRCKNITETEESPDTPEKICRSVLVAEYRVPGTKKELLKSLTDKPEAAELTKAQFAYLHGNIDACDRLSGRLFAVSDNFEIKIGSAFLMGICAMYNGDVDGWRGARTLMERLPCPNDCYIPRKELWLAVHGSAIYDMSDYPEWFRCGCFDLLPPGYYPAAYVHYIKYFYIYGDAMIKNQHLSKYDFNGQLFLLPAICEPLISVTALEKAVVSEIYLRLICAASYHHAGRDELAIQHIDRALALAMPDCIYAPLAEQRPNLDSLLYDRMKINYPDAFDKVRALNEKLMSGWLAIHNTVLGRSRSTDLTAKELEATRLAVFGLTNMEIAGRMGISVNSVKNYLQTVMNKTGAKKRSELARFI